MQDHRTRDEDRTAPTASPGCTSVPLPIHSTCHDALGHVVRYTRAQRGLSQEELGYRAALHRNYVGSIERGEINPTFRVLLKLASGLGTPLSTLIAESERTVVPPRRRHRPRR
jgi:ribosome-binding protein aMBF1 (putative translation factor)